MRVFLSFNSAKQTSKSVVKTYPITRILFQFTQCLNFLPQGATFWSLVTHKSFLKTKSPGSFIEPSRKPRSVKMPFICLLKLCDPQSIAYPALHRSSLFRSLKNFSVKIGSLFFLIWHLWWAYPWWRSDSTDWRKITFLIAAHHFSDQHHLRKLNLKFRQVCVRYFCQIFDMSPVHELWRQMSKACTSRE